MNESFLNHLGLVFFAIASVLSLLLLILRGLIKDYEALALLWIRTQKRINAERKKNLLSDQHLEVPIDMNSKRG